MFRARPRRNDEAIPFNNSKHERRKNMIRITAWIAIALDLAASLDVSAQRPRAADRAHAETPDSVLSTNPTLLAFMKLSK